MNLLDKKSLVSIIELIDWCFAENKANPVPFQSRTRTLIESTINAQEKTKRSL
jgi:hypothetical protein